MTAASQNLTFPDGHSALLLAIQPKHDLQEALDALQLAPPQAVISLPSDLDDLGQIDETVRLRLQQLFSRGVIRAGAEIGAQLVTNGIDGGITALLGQSAVERQYSFPIIGIAPAPLVADPNESEDEAQLPLEPHHTHFVLVETPHWGGEAELLQRAMSAALNQKIPVFTLLANGGTLARAEVLQSVRLGIPIIVIEGSGQLADEIADLYRNPPEFIAEAELAEIVADGKIHLFPIEGKADELKLFIHQLYRQLQGDGLLKAAWQQFGLYDQNARRQQYEFRRLQMAVLMLGVLGTVLAVTYEVLSQHTLSNQWMVKDLRIADCVLQGHSWWDTLLCWFVPTLHYAIIVVPIMTTMLLAAANRFNAGAKWILLRASAEWVKLEIFRYRAWAEIYSTAATTAEVTREIKLAERLRTIAQELMQTDVNTSSLHAYVGIIPPPYSTAADDDGLSRLSPEQYLTARINDQLDYYTSKVKQLEKRLKQLHWFIYIIGGVGTLLAALGLEVWIAVTTAIVTALGTYLEYQQIENTLIKYNQAATDLFSVRTWWMALSEVEQHRQTNIDLLVGQTERILQSEFKGWVKEMQDALAELKEQKNQEGEKQSSISLETSLSKET